MQVDLIAIASKINEAFFHFCIVSMAFALFIYIGLKIPAKLSKEVKGKIGEDRIKFFTWFWMDKKLYRPIHNIILPAPKGKGLTQVDHIFLSRFGIFVVEGKNMGGVIQGDVDDKYWTQKLKREYRFKNPIKQNEYHIKALANLLGIDESEIKSIIVFSGFGALRGSMPDYVLQGASFIWYMESFKDDLYTDQQVDSFVRKIKQARIPKKLAKKQWSQAAKPPATTESKQTEQTPDCPRCKQPMVIREAKKRKNEGSKFWGCSNYPKCKFTISIG